MTTHTAAFRAALKAMHVSGAGALMAPVTRGLGVIFAVHQVRPGPSREPSASRDLTITPDFLEQVLAHLQEAGYDVIRLDDVPARLQQGQQRPFACFTFDGGFRDNREHALPVFERHGLPFAIYVAAEPAEGKGVCDQAGIDPEALAADRVMGWPELKELACHPLVTLGALAPELALAGLPPEAARRQIAACAGKVEEETGQACRHVAFAHGGRGSAGERELAMVRELGLRTAVARREGLVHASHAGTPTALPRLPLGRGIRDLASLEVLLTGAPFAMIAATERVRASLARALTARSAASI